MALPKIELAKRNRLGELRYKARWMLKQEMAELGYTGRSLAEKLGCTEQNVSKVITGDSHSPLVLGGLRDIGVPEKYLFDPLQDFVQSLGNTKAMMSNQKTAYTTKELLPLLGLKSASSIICMAKRESWVSRRRKKRGGGNEWLFESMPYLTKQAIAMQSEAVAPLPLEKVE